MPDPEALVEEFFRATTRPTTTHQEWLLRRSAELLDREATVIRVLEDDYRSGRHPTAWRPRVQRTRASAAPRTGAQPEPSTAS